MKNIIKDIKINKLKYSLLLVIFLLIIYLIIIWLEIYDKKQEIKLIKHDIENKRIESDKLISEIVKIKSNEKKLFQEQEELRIQKEKEQEVNKKWVIKSENTVKNLTQKQNTIIDHISDDSIKKFVTSNKSFNNKKYIPNNLASISSKFVYDTKWWTQILRKVANDNLQLMAEQFFNDTWEKIVVVSAYRSYDYQKWIKDWWCPDNLCAKAGNSEHQSWLAVDLWDATTNYEWKKSTKLKKYYKWLDENAYKYGFHNTYQRWLKIDWYEIEPWHWRYVWKELSKYLIENNQTLAEYYKYN